MDYKIIIITVIVGFLLYMIYNELQNIKQLVETINLDIDTKHQNFITKINGNITNSIHKIKTVGEENLQQLKKIYILNQQPVKRINYFTENDDSEIDGDINFLSENTLPNKKPEGKIDVSKQQDSQFYMSETTNFNTHEVTKNMSYSSSSSSSSSLTESLNCLIDSNIDSTNIVQPSDKNIQQESIVPLVETNEAPLVALNVAGQESLPSVETNELPNDIVIDIESLPQRISNDLILTNIITNPTDEEIMVATNELPNDIVIDIKNLPQRISNDLILTNIITNPTDEEIIVATTKLLNHIVINLPVIDLPTNRTIEIISNEETDIINTPQITTNNTDIIVDEKKKDGEEDEEIALKSLYDTISIKSTSKQSKNNANNKIESISELKHKDTYTVSELQKIAKNLTLNVSNKTGNKWKPLNKDELYNLIKETLNVKHNNI